MSYHFTIDQLICAVLVLLLLLAAAVAGVGLQRGTRTRAFRIRFGSEYNRAVLQYGSPRKAEARLAGRNTHADALKISELSFAERKRFDVEWEIVQSRFVYEPTAAVTEADDLIATLLEARGYPREIFEQRAADVSVTHPRVMEDYRAAHAIATRFHPAEASAQELRTAMIQFRAVFHEFL
jgi:hypothetical protein